MEKKYMYKMYTKYMNNNKQIQMENSKVCVYYCVCV